MSGPNTFNEIGINRLVAVVGRRGAGKSNFLRYVAKNWHAPPPYKDKILLVDSETVRAGEPFPADRIVAEMPPLSQIVGHYSLVIIDESHEFLPGGNRVSDPVAKDLVHKGRHYGLTLVVATQVPFELSTLCRSNSNKLVMFSLVADNDLKWVEKRDSRLKQHRQYLIQAKPGEALVWDGDDYDNQIKTLTIPNVPLDEKPKKFRLFG